VQAKISTADQRAAAAAGSSPARGFRFGLRSGDRAMLAFG
jgi:hypothetical protein